MSRRVAGDRLLWRVFTCMALFGVADLALLQVGLGGRQVTAVLDKAISQRAGGTGIGDGEGAHDDDNNVRIRGRLAPFEVHRPDNAADSRGFPGIRLAE